MPQQVILLIESSSQYGRSLLLGISEAVRGQLDWKIHHAEFDIHRSPPTWLDRIRTDGILSRITNPWLVEYVARTKTPMVELTEQTPDFGECGVYNDNQAIGLMAAEYFIGLGFKHFAYCGYRSLAWSLKRYEAFQLRLAESGFSCIEFKSPAPDNQGDSPELDDELANWLENASKPLAIFACNDLQAARVLRACQKLNHNVPEEVAVLGVDDDEVQRRLAAWPISSIEPGAYMVGYQAANTLAALMAGQTVEPKVRRVQPTGITTRQSTDVLSLDDRELAEALRFIRENACSGIRVNDVLAAVAISRTALEKGTHRLLGRSPKEEILRIRIHEVVRLLTDSDLSLTDIASTCGFKHPEYLSVVVKRETGKTPGTIRKSAQKLE